MRKWQEYVDMYHGREEEEEVKEQEKVKEKEVKEKEMVIKKAAGKKVIVKMVEKKQDKKEEVKVHKKVKIDPEVTIREMLTDPTTIKRLC